MRGMACVNSIRPKWVTLIFRLPQGGWTVPELTRSADIQLNKRLWLPRLPEMLSQPQIVWMSALESSKLMDSVQRCRDQATECVRLMKSAPTKDQARLLENISISWARLTGQIDRHDALVREQGRGPAAA